ncbi:MAG: fumarylacetoacetate hydrolase family protein [Anaerolineales bacterium]|nr:MAG: fumarylacetoacetate hydrolase family protein [Anaerolineales bacterium]
MKIIRFQTASGPEFGILEGETVYNAEGDYASGFRAGEPVRELSQITLLSPCQPTKIIAIGRNYAAHAAEHGDEVPSQPLIFLEPPSAVIGPGEPIVCPPQSAQVEHESELAVVIGRRAQRIAATDAWDHVLGYTCANDVTARDLQRSDGQWSRAKGFDTFAPMGPWIITDLDPANLTVTCRVNNQVKQQGSTSDMVFKIPQLIEYISAAMTLEPGDVILTGTPEGVGLIRPGDQVEVEVEGIGVLSNPVVAA